MSKSINYSSVIDWDSACNVAAELPHGTEEKCEGSKDETFLAGWVNTADMIDAGEVDPNNDKQVLGFVFAEFDNMGYKK